jgi:predicted S18 family serine protease
MYSKLVLFFTESNFVAFNAQSIKVFTEKALRSGFNDFQQKFSTALSSKQQVYTETKQQNEEINENIDLIQGFKQRLKELQQDLSKVNLSE